MLNKTKILCSIGQQSESENVLEEMLLSGMNVARLNLVNGNINVQKRYIETVRKLSLIHNKTLAIMLDTSGPKIKTHDFENGIESIAKGCKIVIHCEKEILGNSNEFSINYPGFFDDVCENDYLLINNGSIKAKIIKKDENSKQIECEALNSGTIQNNCLINLLNRKTSIKCLSNDDVSLLLFANNADVDYIGASFVRNAKDVLEIKDYLKEINSKMLVFAKIENNQAIENFDEILKVADGIIISRGDLSIEVEYELLPIIQKKIIRKCNLAGKPVIVATQILSSMTRNKKPSRAEVSDVANLVLDGVDGISLTNVTTVGLYPALAIKELAKIIEVTEKNADSIASLSKQSYLDVDENVQPLDDAVASAVLATANKVNAKLIIAFSESGATAKRIAKCRPNCPIASVSSDDSIRMSLVLYWGIYPVIASHKTYEIDFVSLGQEIATYYGLKKGDSFIITGGSGIGNTNLMKVCKL